MSSEIDASSSVAPAVPEREVLSWDLFGEASRELAGQVVLSEFDPEIVVAIARGGLLLAGSIAYALGVKSCGSMNVEFYTGVDERLPEPLVIPPMLDGPSLRGRRVLLVDDVSDSGRTLALVRGMLTADNVDVRTVTLYSKPRTVLVPDFVWRHTDRWITFPWSALPPVTRAEALTAREA
ncbi:phosphoribosyltransferase [Mycetocola spongiae]|uniref:phosphoribosyltransferase n=1 Tax=Mycetocola spongiae TaxID=2859226 RepID=UPI001CF14742|nr:phosphoribosyltransferase [Mycetocola spongiae]UCR90251.1 phosphoribosyltransferase [Mycetocola spongiae]